MSDVGDVFRAARVDSRQRRANNRAEGPVQLREAGIEFEMKNGGAHLIVNAGRIDYWPGTGKWVVRMGGASGRGVHKLIRFVKRQTEADAARQVICDYCQRPAALVNGTAVYPHLEDLRALRFWRCAPCDAHVGCHPAMRPKLGGIGDGTVPLGRLADKQLRRVRSQVHAILDPIWAVGDERGRSTRRGDIYRWLANAMGIPEAECHIGMFGLDRCHKAIEVLRTRGQT